MLRKQDLPAWNSGDWPHPHFSVTEAYRAKLFKEVQKALRSNIATRIIKISLCMPLTVFVDLFNTFPVKVSKTMFTVKATSLACMPQFLDKGWDKKTCSSVFCEVVQPSMQLKYMVASQNFIFSFYYKRSRMLGTKLVPMDQDEDSFGAENKLLDIDVVENGDVLVNISLRQCCSLAQLRNDILFETEGSISKDFLFIYNNKKVHHLPYPSLIKHCY